MKTVKLINPIIFNIKNTLLFVILGCSTIFSSCEKDSIKNNEIQVSLQRVADSVYRVFDDQWNIEKSGVMLYISGPSGAYMGSSNITPTPTPDTHFRVASITKTFTAAAIMRLHQEGLLSINDTMGTYIVNNPAYDIPYRSQITIKQLLQHRAGVFDVTNNEIPDTVSAPYAGEKYVDYIRNQNEYHTFTFDELVGINAEHQLSTGLPDSEFHYSNTGYNILGKIIEIVSGMTYSDYITQKFIIPLGLTHTYSVWEGSDVELRTPYVNSHLYIEGNPGIETTEDNMSAHVSEGNIVSTPRDITKWMELLLTGQAGVNAENVALMTEMQIADDAHGLYGLGLVFDEGIGYGHDGAHLSYISSVRHNRETGITVLASANFIRIAPSDENDQSFFELAYGIRDACYAATEVYED
ncbi:serine hydrolase domain-containing protein [Xanthomarina gelatinilytica]|uniref:serine hydrolase domain-containing protein n=1 Tax=Xanthomarina gelatinilytica TaxID=1137281 RepID=UPI003AA9CD08